MRLGGWRKDEKRRAGSWDGSTSDVISELSEGLSDFFSESFRPVQVAYDILRRAADIPIDLAGWVPATLRGAVVRSRKTQ